MAPAQPMPLPEPMNASPHHAKVKVSMTLADRVFVAGDYVAGKMELECRADKGLGVGVILVELFAIQELHSKDHSATSTFLHSKRLFQGPGLPPSNAVQAHPLSGYPALPPNYFQARRGLSTFLFRIPIPETSPSSLTFSSGVGRVRYELRASVGVVWKGERRLVIDNQSLDVVSAFPHELIGIKEPEAVIIGENGKLWIQGRLVGPFIVAGESACLELQVKNHSNKKNTGLSLTLKRTLVLPGSAGIGRKLMELTDTLTHVAFRGAEYMIPPGAEGVANLVFDVPKDARGVRGGILDGDDADGPHATDSLFEICCTVEVKMSMGIGNKDLVLRIPVSTVHPRSIPPDQNLAPRPSPVAVPYPPLPRSPYPNATPYRPPVSPQIPPYMVDHQHVWLPPPSTTPMPYQGHPAYPIHPRHYLASPPPQAMLIPPNNYGQYINRPVSAGANVVVPDPFPLPAAGLPSTMASNPIAAAGLPSPGAADTSIEMDTEAGKGQRASRISRHLRMMSRTRSVSPMAHRFPVGAPSVDVFGQPNPPAQMVDAARPLPQPTAPPMNRAANNSLSPLNTMVHSPRPQATPKHSFFSERPKSERVEVLERMADIVATQLKDLSGTIPKEMMMDEAEVNKTLPPPPVPSEKPALPPRPPLQGLFDAAPAPPRTPTLQAILPKRVPRSNLNNFLAPDNNPSGLDALEKRLLAEVGTRKFDEPNPVDDRRPDVRSVMGIAPIDIPLKTGSSDPLADSAISSLTLANDHKSEDGDDNGKEADRGGDSDQELEAKTHRGGSRSVSGDERGRSLRREKEVLTLETFSFDEALRDVRSRYPREEVDRAPIPAGSTPTRLSAGSGKAKEKEKRSAEVKKDRTYREDRTRTKSEAKGRVAAWLGGIVPTEPPQEEDIPPSPSAARRPVSVLREVGDVLPPIEDDDIAVPFAAVEETQPPPESPDPSSAGKVVEQEASAPNPRSSGFVPIGTLKREAASRPPIADEGVPVAKTTVMDLWAPPRDKTPPPPVEAAPAPPKSPALPKPRSPIPPTRATPQFIKAFRNNSAPSEEKHDKDLPPVNGRPAVPNAPPAIRKPSGVTSLVRNVWRSQDPKSAKKVRTPPSVPPKPKTTDLVKPPAAKLRDFPLLPVKKLDPEVRYDVRSARGGRGGKVTSVTAMWASVAAASGSGDLPIKTQRKEVVNARAENDGPVRAQPTPRPPGKVGMHIPGLVNGAAKLPKSPLSSEVHAPGLDRQMSTTPRPMSGRPADHKEQPDLHPSRVPRRRTSAVNLAQLNASGTCSAATESSQKSAVAPAPAPAPKPKPKPKPTPTPTAAQTQTRGLLAAGSAPGTPGKVTPTNNLSNSSGDYSKPYGLKGFGAVGAGGRRNAPPIVKSTSVPAVLSSSHAIPVLSSTASLARRPTESATPVMDVDFAGADVNVHGGPPKAKAAESSSRPVSRARATTSAAAKRDDRNNISGGGAAAAKANAGPRVVSNPVSAATARAAMSANHPPMPVKAPPPDLAFGQARLRDLIKKYQS